MKYCSMLFSLLIVPTKSIWISSFDSIQLGKDDHLLSGITGVKFLQISVQALHSQFLVNISRGICGHQIFCAQDNIAKLPGCVE